MGGVIMTKWEDLVSDVDLAKVAVERKRSFEKKKVKKKEVQEYLDNGWEIIKTNKNGSASMKKPKKLEILLRMKFGVFFMKWVLKQ